MMETMIKIDLAREQQLLNNSLRESGALFDGNVLPPLTLSPYLISAKKYQRLAYLCKHTINAIEKVLSLYVENKEVQALFPELENYRTLSCIKPDYARWVHLARFDVAESADGKLKLMETNCDCPAAITFISMFRKALDATIMPSVIFSKPPRKLPMDNEAFFVKSLIDLHVEVKGYSPQTIAFLGSAYRRLISDMEPCARISRQLGFNSKHLTIQELTLQNDRLCFDNYPIDIAFQKFDTFLDGNEQVNPCMFEKTTAEVAAYWHAINHKQVLTVSSFPSNFVAENKKIIALLQHPDFKKYFTQEENQAIDEFCPRTFILRKNDKSLIQEIINNKNDYLIKPAMSTRGRGIIIGVDCEQTEWQQSVNSIIDKPYIVQEYIPHVLQEVYTPTSNPVIANMYSNIAMFIVKGEPCGLFGRASLDKITNVGKVGCARVVCVVDD